jgi:hypothetical protein
MGLIRGLVALHNAVDSRLQTEAAIAETQASFAAGGVSEAERWMHHACAPPSAGFALFLDNDWAHCEIDAVRMADLDAGALGGPTGASSASGGGSPYRGGQANQLMGCYNVCAGRHVVSATPGGRGAPAVLPFLLYPGEQLVRRLDREARAWVRVDADEEARLREQVSAHALLLADYFSAVARPRTRAGLSSFGVDVAAVGNEVWKLIIRIDDGAPVPQTAAIARELAGKMVGVPMAAFEDITKMVGRAAWDRFAAGKLDDAWLVANLGLLVLPEEPTLLALLGTLEAKQGKPANARTSLTLALGRAKYLDPYWATQATALLTQLG